MRRTLLLLCLAAALPLLAAAPDSFLVPIPGFSAPLSRHSTLAEIKAAYAPDTLDQDGPYDGETMLNGYRTVWFEDNSYLSYSLRMTLQNDTLAFLQVHAYDEGMEGWFESLFAQLPDSVGRDSLLEENQRWDGWYAPALSLGRTAHPAGDHIYEFYFERPKPE